MFQPISFNVIVQALQWHNFPVPSLRVLSFRDDDPEAVTAEYLATWQIEQIPERYILDSSWRYINCLDRFWRDLQDCFATDVHVVDVTYHPADGTQTALLYVRVDRSTFGLAAELTRFNA